MPLQALVTGGKASFLTLLIVGSFSSQISDDFFPILQHALRG